MRQPVSVDSILDALESFLDDDDDDDDEEESLSHLDENTFASGRKLTDSSPQLPHRIQSPRKPVRGVVSPGGNARSGDFRIEDYQPPRMPQRGVIRTHSSDDIFFPKSPSPNRWSANEAARPAPRVGTKRQPKRNSCSSAMSDISMSPGDWSVSPHSNCHQIRLVEVLDLPFTDMLTKTPTQSSRGRTYSRYFKHTSPYPEARFISPIPNPKEAILAERTARDRRDSGTDNKGLDLLGSRNSFEQDLSPRDFFGSSRKLPLQRSLSDSWGAMSSNSDLHESVAGDGLEDQFYLLLNHDPCEKNVFFDDEVIRQVIQTDPKVCQRQYQFECIYGKVHPLSMLCALGADLQTICLCYEAYPQALAVNDESFGTPLHYACAHKAPSQVVKFLLQKHPSLASTTNQVGQSPMHLLCRNQPSQVTVKLLIKQDSSVVMKPDQDGWLPLHYACDTGADASVIRLLVLANHETFVALTNDQEIALHLAIMGQANNAVLKVLLNGNPQTISVKDEQGQLPLHLAVSIPTTPLECVRLLHDAYPCGVRVLNNLSQSPLDLAKLHHDQDDGILQFLENGLA
jgi:ankyrin repeat protein